VAGGWIILQNVKLHNFILLTVYYWNDQIKDDEMGGACSAHRKARKAYTILVRRP
jgi:hypothetical protein